MNVAPRSRIVWLGVAAIAGAASVVLVLARSEEAVPRADPENSAQVAFGQGVYARHCASCHGANLEGEANWRRRKPDGHLPAPPHDASGHTWHHPDTQIFAVIKHGSAAFIPSGYVSGMPGFVGKLEDREIWAIIAFIKNRWPADIRRRQPSAAGDHR
jgi:mono/diheme cytochrome c family protein